MLHLVSLFRLILNISVIAGRLEDRRSGLDDPTEGTGWESNAMGIPHIRRKGSRIYTTIIRLYGYVPSYTNVFDTEGVVSPGIRFG